MLKFDQPLPIIDAQEAARIIIANFKVKYIALRRFKLSIQFRVKKLSLSIFHNYNVKIVSFPILNIEKISKFTTNEYLVGPECWTQIQLLRICEKLSGLEANVMVIPRNFLIFLSSLLRCFKFS